MDLSGARDLAAAPNKGPKIRLLICLDCNNIEELPDYQGHPDDDYLLQLAVEERHTDRLTGAQHRGHLADVEIRHWSNAETRKQIIKQIWAGSKGLSEVDPDFYDTKSQYQADAMKCFAEHLRPKGQCPDYMSDSKKLVPKTKALRMEVGLPDPKDAVNLPKLCQFCPVHVYNVTRHRMETGAYK